LNENDEKLRENMNSPKSAEIDGQKIEQHSLKEQIELDRYLESKKALRRGLGLRIAKMKAGGSA
jgi:hypothetical protein